jgi:outer membrane protein TolC
MRFYKLFIGTSLFVLPILSFAQKTDFNKIVTPTDSRAKDYTELLVQLAWLNNPRHEALESAKHIEEHQAKLARMTWIDGITASFNINQNAFVNTENNIFFPTYNLNASFNLGAILKTPVNVKAAQEKIRITEYNIDQTKLQLRAEVLRRHRDYLYAIDLLKLRTQAVEDLYSSFIAIKESFEKGTTSFRTYMEASQSYNKALQERLEAENDLSKSRITLEEIVGAKLDDIDKMERK